MAKKTTKKVASWTEKRLVEKFFLPSCLVPKQTMMHIVFADGDCLYGVYESVEENGFLIVSFQTIRIEEIKEIWIMSPENMTQKMGKVLKELKLLTAALT